MNVVRQSIFALSFLMGLWVLASFVGVMFNPSNAGLSTTSLMWALLAGGFVMPGLVMVYHVARSSSPAGRQTKGTAPSLSRQPAFVDEEEQEGALWPELDEQDDPQKESRRS